MSAPDRFVYIWEYTVRPETVARFRAIYGPAGDWVRLFARSPGFVRTELYRDAHDPHRFVTVDVWRSAAARDQFRTEHADAFAALDRACAALTEAERFLGDFHVEEDA